MRFNYLLMGTLAILTAFGCESERSAQHLDDRLKIRLATEPDRLNPMLSRQASASEIERFIFCPLEDFHPFTLQLEPVLLKKRAQAIPIESGKWKGGMRFLMEIRDEATWDDGHPVTGYDYLFSMKAALNPYVSNNSWAAYVRQFTSITIDSTDPKQIEVIMDHPYILSEGAICGFNLYPETVYDSSLIYRTLSFDDLKRPLSPEHDRLLREWADAFNSDRYNREKVQGCGRYKLVEWQAGRHIILEKKANHWAEGDSTVHPNLKAYPKRIEYYFIPEEQTAITNLKDHKIHLMSDISPQQFEGLKADRDQQSQLTLESAPILQYYFVAYNNDHPLLGDRLVRSALSHTIDVETIIDELFSGLASRTVGPIHPSKPYYHTGLKPLELDLTLASNQLQAAGWLQEDEGSVRYRADGGNRQELRLNILTSRSPLSQDLAVIMKENAARIGVELQIISLDFRVLTEQVKRGDFDLACLASTQSLGFDDPFSSWHSSNATLTGSNLCKFRNTACDHVIEEIRVTLDEQKLTELYKDFQSIIYEQQPALFLVAPRKAIAAVKGLKIQTSASRPGYFANLIQPNPE